MATRRFIVQEIVECPTCGGKGEVKVQSFNGVGNLVTHYDPCKECGKSGYVFKATPLEEALEYLNPKNGEVNVA